MGKRDLIPLLAGALLLTLAFPPFPGGVLVPFVLAYLFEHLTRQRERIFARGYVFGVFLGVFTLYWIGMNTIPGAIVTILINALHYGVVFYLFHWLYRRKGNLAWWGLPFLWTGLEYLRHFSDLRFNWLSLAYTQTYYLPFIQLSEWTGYLGITLLLMWLTVLWQRLHYQGKPLWREGGVFLLLVALPLALGFSRMHSLTAKMYPGLRAALVQPNVDPWHKWDPQFQDSAFVQLAQATLEVAPRQPDLVVWPETATPFFLRHEPRYLQRIFALVDSLQIHLITGTPDYRYFPETQDYRTYNAAFFFAPGMRSFLTYYKMALVPVAESMPFKQWLPWLRKVDLGGGDFFPGQDFRVFPMHIPFRAGHFQQGTFRLLDESSRDSIRVGVSTVICFESVFPHLVRQFVRNGAQLLTIITNDGWFGPTSGPYQHARYAIFRAVENRVSIVRCANTGISFFVDLVGRIHHSIGYNRKGTAVADLPISTVRTWYTRYGDWPGWLSLLLAGGIWALGVRG